MSDKTLVERLREVNLNCGKHTHCQIANALGVKCTKGTCDECGKNIAYALADAIEREYLSRPRFDDGELVREGDTICIDGELPLKVYWYSVRSDGLTDFSCPTSSRQIKTGERVKRPEHIALDADGVPIHLGDTVYLTDGVDAGKPLTVDIVHDNGVVNVAVEPERWANHAPETLTHKKPALDADGVPIRVGDTVYELGTGEVFKVEEITSADTFCVFVTEGWYFAPCSLTHKEPDSIARIVADAMKRPCDYFESRYGQCEDCRAYDRLELNCSACQALDLLHRQREVLERDYLQSRGGNRD